MAKIEVVPDTAPETAARDGRIREAPERKPREPSLAGLVGELRDDIMTLLRQELALMKRETTGKAAFFGRNAAMLAAGAVIAWFCLMFLLLSLSGLIQAGLFAAGFSGTVSAWLAPLLVGMLLGIAALFMALKAMRALRREKPLPEKSLDSLRRDRDWLKGKPA